MNFTKSVFILITALVTSLLSSGCKKDFLEILPKGRLIATTTNDYNLSLNNLSLLTVSFLGEPLAPVVLGDEIVSVEPYFMSSVRRYQRLFRFEDHIYNADEDAYELIRPMQNIYVYNKIINEVMSSAGGSEAQKRSIQAEARIGRAWTYFLLINFYGKHYNENTAALDPGFPIIIQNDLAATNFSRNTVQEVYDFIIEDLTLALEDAPIVLSSRLRASKPAAEGLLAKVYTYMGRYSDALPYYNSALNSIPNSPVRLGLISYENLEMDEPFGYDFPLTPDNSEIIYAKQIDNTFSDFYNELVVNSAVSSLYSTSDFRMGTYTGVTIFGEPYLPGFLRRNSPSSIQIGVTLPELYLLRAECFARLGQLQAAIADLETLRAARIKEDEEIKVPALAMSSRENLVRFVFEERLREFATLGFRWYDMRRMVGDPIFESTTYNHLLYNEDGSVKDIFLMNPNRLVLKIPAKIMLQNPGMQDNP